MFWIAGCHVGATTPINACRELDIAKAEKANVEVKSVATTKNIRSQNVWSERSVGISQREEGLILQLAEQ